VILIPLFACIGFLFAVLYIDLTFDVSAVAYRRSKTALPNEVLDPITHYYGRITRNPYVLVVVMLTTIICIGAEIVYGLAPQWVGYSSLLLMGVSILASTLKVIPTAQRIGSGKDLAELRTPLIHSMMPFHVLLLIDIFLLAAVQVFGAVVSS
jgi:hypothetical protein